MLGAKDITERKNLPNVGYNSGDIFVLLKGFISVLLFFFILKFSFSFPLKPMNKGHQPLTNLNINKPVYRHVILE